MELYRNTEFCRDSRILSRPEILRDAVRCDGILSWRRILSRGKILNFAVQISASKTASELAMLNFKTRNASMKFSEFESEI